MTADTQTPKSWDSRYSQRILGTKTSFIREILKVTENPAVISFAGGLPAPELFPVEAIAAATQAVLRDEGRAALQYSTTEGFLPLREWICERYARRFGLKVSPEEVLITTGSQQALDLIGKVFLNPGDGLAIEQPGYLGAIQCFSVYQPNFVGIPSSDTGPEKAALSAACDGKSIKLIYTVPNFQNPSGATYSPEARQALAEQAQRSNAVLVEDDPYGELRYRGSAQPSLRCLNPETLLLGTFSKIAAPGFRLGWVCAPREVIRKLVVAKQAADLHSDIFAQRVLARFLRDNDLNRHIATIQSSYGARAAAMVSAFRELMPAGCACNDPEGGMFVWATLPAGFSSRAFFDRAIERQVAFVPGTAFHFDGGGENAMRLNFTNTPVERIRDGITRLARAFSLPAGA